MMTGKLIVTRLVLNSSISELQNFIYDDSYVGQSSPACCQAPAAIRGSGCTIYESSYIEFWNSEIELIYHDGNRDYTQMVPIGKSFKG